MLWFLPASFAAKGPCQELLKNPGSGHAPFLTATLPYWGIQEGSTEVLEPQRTTSVPQKEKRILLQSHANLPSTIWEQKH